MDLADWSSLSDHGGILLTETSSFFLCCLTYAHCMCQKPHHMIMIVLDILQLQVSSSGDTLETDLSIRTYVGHNYCHMVTV